jgi:hypothetical protein
MIVKHAKAVARQWVIEEANRIPGFYAAFFHGSINWLPDDAELPATSDIDIMVVLDDADPQVKLGKFIHQNVLLEVSYLPGEQLQSPDLILGNYHLAGSFRTPSIISDPTGHLTRLQAAVARCYAKRQWVRKRCEHARARLQNDLQALNTAATFHDQVLAWLFGTGKAPHILLVAGLQNPTVRRRYLAVHSLLRDYGHLDFHTSLLEMLGCAQMSQRQAEHHLAALAATFDATQAVIKTPFFFASDIDAAARPLAIEGSRELIEAGYHREAIFWIVATYSRCQKALYHDASAEVQDRFNPGYRRLLGDLGIASLADLQRRSRQIEEHLLPRIWEVTEAILAANPAIED